MIAEAIFATSLATFTAAYALHRRGGVDPQPPPSPPPPEEIDVDVPIERRIGEILMMPLGTNSAHYNSYAVLVREHVGSDYYVVQTFHEVPKLYTVHTSQLLTKEELESRSRLPIEP